MTVCKFWMQNRCKYGGKLIAFLLLFIFLLFQVACYELTGEVAIDSCRFEHPPKNGPPQAFVNNNANRFAPLASPVGGGGRALDHAGNSKWCCSFRSQEVPPLFGSANPSYLVIALSCQFVWSVIFC